MKISIIAVGKLKERYFVDCFAEYAKRLRKYCDFNVVEVSPEAITEKMSAAQAEAAVFAEGNRIRSFLKPGMYIVAMDAAGKLLSSEAFAEKIESCMIGGKPDIVFLVGGSAGLDGSLIADADMVVSMSKMTFPHQLARIILSEQIYRAYKIINNETYHK